jgi:hypothetical protein
MTKMKESNMTPTAKPEAEWIVIVRADVVATGSINKTARRVGVSRPALSQILNGIGHYGTGKASTAKVEAKVMNTIGMVACPFLSEYHGAEHRITGLQCREYAYRDNPPTSVPRDMQHWRACQSCAKRVTVSAPKLPIALAQQAGVIDKVTLPLPEVGAPQVLTEVV